MKLQGTFSFVGRELRKRLSLPSRLRYHIEDVLNENRNGGYSHDKDYADLFSIHAKLLDKHEISQYFSPEHKKLLQNSLLDCQTFIERKATLQDIIERLRPNENSSFVIVPLISKKHLYAAIIRKVSDNEYRFTVINKGGRSFNSIAEEFTMDKRNLEKTYRKYSFQSILDFPFKKILTQSMHSAYMDFHKHSIYNNSNFSLQNSDQKTGNCYFKEMEFAIKAAIATANKSFSEINFSNESAKLKWPLPTALYHKLYIEELLHQYEDKIDQKFIHKMQSKMEEYLIHKTAKDISHLEGIEPQSLQDIVDISSIYLMKETGAPSRVTDDIRNMANGVFRLTRFDVYTNQFHNFVTTFDDLLKQKDSVLLMGRAAQVFLEEGAKGNAWKTVDKIMQDPALDRGFLQMNVHSSTTFSKDLAHVLSKQIASKIDAIIQNMSDHTAGNEFVQKHRKKTIEDLTFLRDSLTSSICIPLMQMYAKSYLENRSKTLQTFESPSPVKGNSVKCTFSPDHKTAKNSKSFTKHKDATPHFI